MKRNQIGYLILFLILAGLLFFTSKAFLAVMIVILLTAGFISVFLLKLDARNIKISMNIAAGVQQGKSLLLNFFVVKSEPIFAARAAVVEIELKNKILERMERKLVTILFDGKVSEFSMPIETLHCGEISVKCVSVHLLDVFQLYSIAMPLPDIVYSVIYPKKINLQLTLSHAALGMPKDDGLMQNRKGNDPSEMYDVREYVPGDDVRSIHWKLSSKTDSLVLRQASDPSHYNVVIVPDYGMNQIEDDKDGEKLNFAISLGASIVERLLQQGINFCMALPAEKGLKIFEITEEKQLQKMISEWLSSKIPTNSGIGIQYFATNHLDQYFSKLIILSAGTYEENFKILEGRIAVTVLNASQDKKIIHTKVGIDCDVTELPIHGNPKDTYHIVC